MSSAFPASQSFEVVREMEEAHLWILLLILKFHEEGQHCKNFQWADIAKKSRSSMDLIR